MKIKIIIGILLLFFVFFKEIKAENIDSLINKAELLSKKGDYIKAIEAIKISQNLCKTNSDKKHLIKSYIQLSNIYLKLSKFSESLQSLLTAENIAKTENFKKLQAQIYNSLAVLYFEAGEDNVPDEYIKKVELYITKAYNIIKNNKLKSNDVILNYGVMMHMYKNKPDSALQYFRNEIKSIDTTDYIDLIYLHEYIGHIYKNKNDYRSALNSHLTSLHFSEKDNNENLKAMNYSNIAFCYSKLNKPDSALIYAEMSLKSAKSTNNKYALQQTLEILIDIYYNKNDIKNYHKYRLNLDSVTEKYYNNETSREFAKMQFELNMKIKDMKIDLLENENQLKNTKMKISVIIFSVIALTLILLIFTMKKREKYRKIINRQKLEILTENEQSVQLRNEKLENEIKLRSRELITKTMLIVKNKEVMDSIYNKMQKLQQVTKKANQDLIKEILTEIKVNSKDFWDDFYLYFNGIHTDFLDKLNSNYPDLTNTEKKICALIKLNLSSNDISKITSTSPRTIEKHRANIRKKINIEKGIKLSEYLKVL